MIPKFASLLLLPLVGALVPNYGAAERSITGCTTINIPQFNLRAVYTSPDATGPLLVPIKPVTIQTTIKQTTLSLAVSNTSGFPTSYNTLTNGAIINTYASVSTACSYAVQAGQTPLLLWQQYCSNYAFSGYCGVDTSSGTRLLAVNGHTDSWSLCTNTTREANGRINLVYDPQPDSPHYTLSECKPVTVEII